jgi:hypothetical protein
VFLSGIADARFKTGDRPRSAPLSVATGCKGALGMPESKSDNRTDTGAPDPAPPARVPILDLVRYFLKLGATGFGGPVALCGLMEH